MSLNLWASEGIGTVASLKGVAWRSPHQSGEKIMLAKDSSVFESDQIVTSEGILKIHLVDDTVLVLGPNSKFNLANFKNDPAGKRENLFDLLLGKLRIKINKKASEEDKIIINTPSISLGVRGTEILSNAYLVKNEPTTDLALLSGKGELDTSQLGIDTKSIELNKGEAVNTNLLKEKGVSSVQTLSPSARESLQNNEMSFLPNMQSPDGTSAFKNSDSSKPSTAEVSVALADANKIIYIYKSEKEEGWDIQDARKHHDQLKEKNECYYWEYKVIPGSLSEHRFRRERHCDEY